MYRCAAWLALAVLSCAWRNANAQERPTEPQHYQFEDDLVAGDIVRPEDDLVSAGVHRRGETLLRIRANFIPELLRSTDAI